MSESVKCPVICPHCGERDETVYWKSINTSLQPEMAAKVRDETAFLWKCPNCGEEAVLEYDFLYHQQESDLMIQVARTDEAYRDALRLFSGEADLGAEKENTLFRVLLRDMRVRVVRSYRELREKLAIFDAGLDDRVIELMKVFCLYGLGADSPAADAEETLLAFNEDGTARFDFLTGGRPFASVDIPEEGYSRALEDFGADLPEKLLAVDFDWALSFLKAHDDGEDEAPEGAGTEE